MTDDPQQAEIERLRAELESYRQRELADLKAALTQCREERDNYRAEAYRNAEAGRQIASHYQAVTAALQARLDARESLNNGRRKFAESN